MERAQEKSRRRRPAAEVCSREIFGNFLELCIQTIAKYDTVSIVDEHVFGVVVCVDRAIPRFLNRITASVRSRPDSAVLVNGRSGRASITLAPPQARRRCLRFSVHTTDD
jgi:hypothetical protein